MDEITKIETVDQYDQLFGLETLHPLVNVIDFSKATRSVEYIRMNIGFYCLFLKDAKCGECGKSLTVRYTNAKHPQRIYSCKTYNAFGKNHCTQHRIDYDTLYSHVLRKIR